MSVTWRVLSPITPRQMLEVERECERTLEQYLRDHPKVADRWGELSAGGTVPRRGDVEGEYRRLRVELRPRLRQRLEACQSVMSIEAPAELRSSPLQVSLLRFLLERAGEALIMFNDYPLQETEQVLESLHGLRGAAGFPDGPPDRSKRGPRGVPISEVRALRILEVVRHAESNMEQAVDLRDALSRLSPLSRRYLGLLYEEGMVDDLKACRMLGVKPEELEPAIEALDRALTEIEPD